MSESLKERLNDAVKTALKAADKRRLGALRLVTAAIKQREVDERIVLDDTQVLAVLEKLLKQRKESLAVYQSAGRQDLAEQEFFEIGVLQEFLPEQLSPEVLADLVKQAIIDTQATSAKDMGKVIAALKPRLQGQADMGVVSGLVKQALSQQ